MRNSASRAVDASRELPRQRRQPRRRQLFDADLDQEFSIHYRCAVDLAIARPLGHPLAFAIGTSVVRLAPTHAFAIATASCRTRRM